jgi:hypothetical protein
MIKAVSVKDLNISNRRMVPVWMIMMVFYEIFILVVCAPILLVSVYRIPVTWRKTR